MSVAEVTSEQVSTFRADGAVCLRGILGRDWLERLWKASDEAMARPPKDPEQRYFRRIGLWREVQGFGELCRDSILPRLAATFLDTPKVNLLYDQLFVKEPDMVDPSAWHNDQPYWPVRGAPTMSFSVPLDHVDESLGAIEFIRGSHLWDAWYQPMQGDEEGRLKKTHTPHPGFIEQPDFEAERERHEILSYDMEPGDVLAFHGLLVHAGTANTTGTKTRRAYTARYACGRAHYFDTSDIPGRNERLLNPELRPGDPLDSEMFPVVYRE